MSISNARSSQATAILSRPLTCLLRSRLYVIPLFLCANSVPNTLSQGKYTVEADVYTKDDEPITCLKATVTFNFGDRFFEEEEL